MELAYMYTDFELYGVDFPYCFTPEEADKIWKFTLKDRGLEASEYPFDELFREATQEEIDDYGYGI